MKVTKIKSDSVHKTLTFDDGKTLVVTRSSRVREGDEVGTAQGRYYVVCANGLSQLYPTYDETEVIMKDSLDVVVHFKEPSTQQEIDEIEFLASYHYLEGNPVKLAYLVATTNEQDLPHTLGYVLMTPAFHACAPRSAVVKAAYETKQMDTNWGGHDGVRSFAPPWFAVRIARVVVHPEFRGTGIAKLLFKHAINFARDYWSMGAYKPLIIEAVAEMFRYIPFAKAADMYYLGMTSTASAKEALSSLKARDTGKPKIGIKRYQEVYLQKLEAVADRLHKTPAEVVELVKRYDELSPEERVEIFEVLRVPKPFYARGLTEAMNKIVQDCARALERKDAIIKPTKRRQRRLSASIEFKNIDVIFSGSAKVSDRTASVQAAFGVNPKSFDCCILEDFNFVLPPASIVLLRGLSGSGKTTVLRLFKGDLAPSKGEVIYPKDTRIIELLPFEKDEALIELIGETMLSALSTLNRIGLAEAKLYLKSYSQLSTGQRYRAALARLMDSDANVWIADEFCSSLDRITANIVAHNTQRHVRKNGITFICACANPESYVKALKPDFVIELMGGSYRIYENGTS